MRKGPATLGPAWRERTSSLGVLEAFDAFGEFGEFGEFGAALPVPSVTVISESQATSSTRRACTIFTSACSQAT